MVEFEYEDSKDLTASSNPKTFKTLVIIFSCFFLWLIAGVILVKMAVRSSPAFLNIDPTIHAKLIGLESAGDELETVFVGSSRVHRQIDPFWIETSLVEKGCGTGSVYNLGVGGSSSSTTRFLLDYALRARPEVDRLWVEPWGADQWSTRDSNINYALAPLWSYPIWNDRLSFKGDKKELILAKLSTMSFLNYGMFHAMVENFGAEPRFDQIGFQGFQPLDENLPFNHSRRKLYRKTVKNQPNYFRDILISAKRLLEQETSASSDGLTNSIDIFLDGLTTKDLQRIGLILLPMQKYSQVTSDYVEIRGINIPIISTPIEKYDWLGNPENYIDRGHLNRKGATRLSKAVAEQICKKTNIKKK